MKLFEGKSPTERNKIIAAAVLGVLCLAVLYYTFGRGLFGGTTPTTTVKISTTPKTTSSPTVNADDFKLPTKNEQDFEYTTTAINYRPDDFRAPDPGRNIFAFYEPPPPCKGAECPTPIPPPVVINPPTPEPTPPILIAFVTPQSVYAGSKTFRMEVTGDRFTPDARIYFSQSELRTTFISGQKMIADVPANFIAAEGPRQILVQTLDGKAYSNQVLLNVQAPPAPQFTYIGMIARKRANNDTAYFLEAGKTAPLTHRLNDVVSGRFRLMSISETETVLEDVNLGFRHRLPLVRTSAGGSSSPQPSRPGGFPSGGTYVPYNQGFPPTTNIPQSIPGIPDNIPRYVPPDTAKTPRAQPEKKDVDDEDDDGDG
ncbi:MAG: hypothetical protein H7070_13135 [Saprospiraceae bacterium]|nr:hypothetical protein [Pyrinomonadaceae bacterium]